MLLSVLLFSVVEELFKDALYRRTDLADLEKEMGTKLEPFNLKGEREKFVPCAVLNLCLSRDGDGTFRRVRSLCGAWVQSERRMAGGNG